LEEWEKVQEKAQALTNHIKRNKRTLQQAEERAQKKIICLLSELEVEEEEEYKRNRGYTNSNLVEAAFNFPTFLGVSDGSNQVD
jgi:hypothetical protein